MVSPRVFDQGRERAAALAARTSLGVGGRARYLFEPDTVSACVRIVRACHADDVPLFVLGGGFNLLVGDGAIDGAVLATRRLVHCEVSPDRVAVGAGHSFPRLVRQAISLGIPGLPGCPGIPGSVGGVVAMNAGGRFGSAADALVAVTGIEPDGTPFEQEIGPGDMGYRKTVFGGRVVTGAVFRRDLTLDASAQRALFEEALAWKKATQPLGQRSAGCIFKNPPGARSAGRLIDEAGLKGHREGRARVSPVHANFIVTEEGATAAEVHRLIRHVRREVERVHGVALELEVCVWGGDT